MEVNPQKVGTLSRLHKVLTEVNWNMLKYPDSSVNTKQESVLTHISNKWASNIWPIQIQSLALRWKPMVLTIEVGISKAPYCYWIPTEISLLKTPASEQEKVTTSPKTTLL